MIAGLRRLGVGRIVVLSGDEREIAEAVGAQAGADEVIADCTPEAKVAALGAIRARPGALERDVRDVTADELTGFDAVVHLAALSNDPIGTSTQAGRTTSISTAPSSSRAARRRRASAGSCSRLRARCTARPRVTSWYPKRRR